MAICSNNHIITTNNYITNSILFKKLILTSVYKIHVQIIHYLYEYIYHNNTNTWDNLIYELNMKILDYLVGR